MQQPTRDQILSQSFWLMTLAILIQLLTLGWTQDKGVNAIVISLILLTIIGLATIIFTQVKRLAIVLFTLAGWIAYAIVAPAITLR